MADYILSHTGAELDAAITKALSMGELEDKTATPSLTEQVITASEGKTLDSVTVGAVTGSLVSSLDSNFTAANIASGVTILGVTGTYGGGSGLVDTGSAFYTINDPYFPWGDNRQYSVTTALSSAPSNGMVIIQLGVQGSSNAFCQVFNLNDLEEWESYAYAGLNSYTISVSGNISYGYYTFTINVTTSTQNLYAAYKYVLW